MRLAPDHDASPWWMLVYACVWTMILMGGVSVVLLGLVYWLA